MKKNKWLTLLSVALCASTLFGACSFGSSGSSSSESSSSSTDEAPVVEATFSNFIKTEYTGEWKDLYNSSSENLNKKYGTIQQENAPYYLFYKADRNFVGEIVETWTLVDATAKRDKNGTTNYAVWTKENKYKNGDYTGEDVYGNQKKQPSVMEVSIKTANASYIEVVTTKNDKYTEEEMRAMYDEAFDTEKVPSYKVTQTTEWYSLDGKLITSVATEAGENVQDIQTVNGKHYALFGNTIAAFDEETQALVETWDVKEKDKEIKNVEEKKHLVYEVKMEGDVLSVEISHKETGALLSTYQISFTEYFYSQMGMVGSSIGLYPYGTLESGDLLIQKITATESGAKADVIDKDGLKLDVTTKRMDAETGVYEDIATEYIYTGLYGAEEFAEEYFAEDSGFSFTENVYNIATAYKIVDGKIDRNQEVIVFFDNALNVQYEWAPLVPEQVDVIDNSSTIEMDSMKVLSNGQLLVNLSSAVKDKNGRLVKQAIITTKGELVRYIPSTMKVYDTFMTEVEAKNTSACRINFYKLNGEKFGSMPTEYMYEDSNWYTYSFYQWDVENAFLLGDHFTVPGLEYTRNNLDDSFTVYKRWRIINIESGYMSYTTDYAKGEIVALEKDYMIVMTDAKEYVVYDATRSQIVKTDAGSERPVIYARENGYYCLARIDGNKKLFIFKYEGGNY